jgi:hypothetical protein
VSRDWCTRQCVHAAPARPYQSDKQKRPEAHGGGQLVARLEQQVGQELAKDDGKHGKDQAVDGGREGAAGNVPPLGGVEAVRACHDALEGEIVGQEHRGRIVLAERGRGSGRRARSSCLGRGDGRAIVLILVVVVKVTIRVGHSKVGDGRFIRHSAKAVAATNGLQAHHLGIDALWPGHQVGVVAFLHHHPLAQDDDAVGMLHGREAVGNDQCGTAPRGLVQCTLHSTLALGVESGRGLVQD